jgi:hypothetical protein
MALITLGDFRDPNLSYHPILKKLYLSIAIKKTDGPYVNYMYELDSNFDAVATYQITGMDNYFTWGNTLLTKDEKNMLRVAYSINATGGVKLFKSGTATASTLPFTEVAEIFPPSSAAPTEVTISKWGSKLVCFARQNTGNTVYRETYDLDGATGWGAIKDLGFIGHFPTTIPYIPEGEPLLLAYGHAGTGFFRSPYVRMTFDGFNYSSEILIDKLEGVGGGGYCSMVENQNGYAFMYYQDGDDATKYNTNVFYREIDILKYFGDEYTYLKESKGIRRINANPFRTDKSVDGNALFIDKLFVSNASIAEMEFVVKKPITLKSVEFFLSNNNVTNAAATLEVYENGVLLGTSNGISISAPRSAPIIHDFPFSTSLSLVLGKTYKFKITNNTAALYCKEFPTSFNMVDFGNFIYTSTKYSNNPYDKHLVPFGLVKTV